MRAPRPFGLQFAETAPAPPPSLPLSYDEERDLTVATLPDGTRPPYVALTHPGTATHTLVNAEEADSDRQTSSTTTTFTEVRTEQTDAEIPGVSVGLATETITKAAAAQGDTDVALVLGTKTATRVQHEETDSDKSATYALGTETATFVASERPDRDPGSTLDVQANDLEPDVIARTADAHDAPAA